MPEAHEDCHHTLRCGWQWSEGWRCWNSVLLLLFFHKGVERAGEHGRTTGDPTLFLITGWMLWSVLHSLVHLPFFLVARKGKKVLVLKTQHFSKVRPKHLQTHVMLYNRDFHQYIFSLNANTTYFWIVELFLSSFIFCWLFLFQVIILFPLYISRLAQGAFGHTRLFSF